MNFLYPAAFAGLITIPAIIAMYLIKQNYKEYKNSSNILWAKAASTALAQKPWQKLRREILMFLQILAAALIVLALSNPFIIKKGLSDSYIFILDTTLSMQAEDTPGSRFQLAKKSLSEAVNGLPPDASAALVIAGKEPYIAVNFTSDKSRIVNEISTIEPTFSEADEESLKSLIDSLFNQTPSDIYIYSDYGFNLEGQKSVHVPFGDAADNRAITLMSHSVDADRIVSLVKIKNYGTGHITDSVALYADDRLVDVLDFQAAPGEEASVFFTEVPYGSNRLMAKLTTADLLPADDIYFDAVNKESIEKAIIFSRQNVFLENILALMPSLELYKGNIDDIEMVSGYYLYIFDGVLPENIPSDGHILIFNPPVGNGFITAQGEEETGAIYTGGGQLFSYMGDVDFNIAKAKVLDLPQWADAALSSDAGPLVLSGIENGRKAAVFAFDLHNTDFPLKKEFPIFMYNLTSWLIPQNVSDKENIYTGDNVKLNVYPSSRIVKIAAPDGVTYNLEPPFPDFTETGRPGFYTVVQSAADGDYYSDFAVNISPFTEESNLRLHPSYNGDGETGSYQGEKSLNLKNPCIVFALLVLLAEWYILNRRKFKKPDILRLALILLLILSLPDFSIKRHAGTTTTVFAFDLSASVSQSKGEMTDFVNESLTYKNHDDIVGAVAFAGNSFIELFPREGVNTIDFTTHVDGNFTNISKALLLSRSVIPENTKKRITLISDGGENIGDTLSAARILNSAGIAADVYEINTQRGEDVQISSLTVPKAMNKDVDYSLGVNIYANSANRAALKVYKNDILIISADTELKTGENRLVFTDKSDIGGNVIYRAEILPRSDVIYENNFAFGYSYVEDIPNVLLVSRDGSGDEIKKMTETAGVALRVVDPAALPEDIEWLNAYDGIILADISLDDMPDNMPALLESYTRGGGGVVVTGGENSYALGGYHKTKLEELLPVSMELRDEGDLPTQGMIVVVDRSGSMQGGRYGLSKMELAKEAVIRSIDALSSKDYFGVLAFDTENMWPVKYQLLGENPDDAKERVSYISPGGGTAILPALTEAFNVLKDSDVKLKHIILLTDGQDSSTGYDALINQMTGAGVTLSTVAVGGDSDIELLQRLASEGGGRYYYSDEFTDLPKVFTKETFMAGKKYINDEEFYPLVGDISPIMEGIDSLPAIGGYISSTPKNRGDMVLMANDKEPLLGAWQYGLGRSAAYLSDYGGIWSSKLINSAEGVRLFRNTLGWALRKQTLGEVTADIEFSGTGSKLTVKTPYLDTAGTIEAKILGPDLMEADISLDIVSPGEYQGEIPFSGMGAYMVNMRGVIDGKEQSLITGFNIPYSQEYNIESATDRQSPMVQLARITGGRVLTGPEEVFAPLDQKVYKEYAINYIFIILALLLFLFDIAARRFSFLGKLIKAPVKKKEEKAESNNTSFIVLPKSKDIVKHENKIIPEDNSNKTSAILLKNKKKRSGR